MSKDRNGPKFKANAMSVRVGNGVESAGPHGTLGTQNSIDQDEQLACMEIEDEKAGEFFSIDGMSNGPKSIRKMKIELGSQFKKPRESLTFAT